MTVYLLHFKKPINPSCPAQHYLGWTSDLDERIRAHRRGRDRACAKWLSSGALALGLLKSGKAIARWNES